LGDNRTPLGFKKKKGRRKFLRKALIIPAIFGLVVSMFLPLIQNSDVFAALPDEFNLNRVDIVKRTAAIKYLRTCYEQFSSNTDWNSKPIQTVSGSDIQDFNWSVFQRNTAGNSTLLNTGEEAAFMLTSKSDGKRYSYSIDGSGNIDIKDGSTPFRCNQGDYSARLKAAFTTLGVANMPKQILCNLGYTQYQYTSGNKFGNKSFTGRTCVQEPPSSDSPESWRGTAALLTDTKKYIDKLESDSGGILSDDAFEFALQQILLFHQNPSVFDNSSTLTLDNSNCPSDQISDWVLLYSLQSNSLARHTFCVKKGGISMTGISEMLNKIWIGSTNCSDSSFDSNRCGLGSAKAFENAMQAELLKQRQAACKDLIAGTAGAEPAPDGISQDISSLANDSATIAACVAGMTHPNHIDFCDTATDDYGTLGQEGGGQPGSGYVRDKYPKYNTACHLGQGSPVGEDSVLNNGGTENPDGSNQPTCESTWSNPFSWIFCPIMDITSGLVDGMNQYIIDNILNFSPMIGNNASDLKNAWQAFVNLANIGLVIVFLILIYSTAVGGGRK